MAALDDLPRPLVAREGEFVVYRRRGDGNQVEGAVRIRLWERVAVLGEASPERRERSSHALCVAAVERTGEAQAQALVVLAVGVICHASCPLPLGSALRAWRSGCVLRRPRASCAGVRGCPTSHNRT